MGTMTDVERGSQLAELRKKVGLTQAQVGAAFGTTKQAVSEWETGKSSPDKAKIAALDGLYRAGGKVLALYGIDIGDEYVTREDAMWVANRLDAVEKAFLGLREVVAVLCDMAQIEMPVLPLPRPTGDDPTPPAFRRPVRPVDPPA